METVGGLAAKTAGLEKHRVAKVRIWLIFGTVDPRYITCARKQEKSAIYLNVRCIKNKKGDNFQVNVLYLSPKCYLYGY